MTTTTARPITHRLAAVAVALAAGLLLPVLVHLVPVDAGPPAGARLLPIFIAPLIVALRFDAVSALSVALLSPLLNSLLTGMPAGPMLSTLLIELLVFVGIVLAARRLAPRWAGPAAPVAYLAAAALAGLVVPPAVAPTATLMAGVQVGWPGLVLLLAAGFLARPEGGAR